LESNKRSGVVPGNISAQEIREQLVEIFKSKDFVASQRLMDFLAYVTEEALKNNAQNIKAYNIAVDVFGMGIDFDALTNPLVRTEAVRLRSKLEHYYLLNPTAAVHISIPKGAYVPLFSRLTEKRKLISDEWSLPELHTTILILQFENISKTTDGESFNAGLVNEITNALIKFRDLTVIDSDQHLATSSASEKQATQATARFILKGSLQTQKKRFKLWVSLTDSRINRKIWTESFDGDFKQDIFEAQEIIAEKIVYRIAADFGIIQKTLLKELDVGQMPSSFIQKSQLLYHRWVSRLSNSDFRLALVALQEALTEEPGDAFVQAMLADLYAANYQMSYGIVEDDLEQSLKLATNAANLDPKCQVAHLALAMNYFLRSDRTKFLINADRALKINPTSSSAMTTLASWYGFLGYWDEALELTKKIFQLNPAPPGWCHSTLAFYHYYREDYGKAMFEAQKINMPQMLWDPLFRLISAARLNEASECAQAYTDLMNLFPNFEKDSQIIVSRSIPNQEYTALIQDGLKAAWQLMK
jgi:TolB-like protein